MSLNPDIRDQAYQFFIEEAQELLQVLESGLLGIREDHSTPKVHELMRAAHSIKGGAASVELSTIELLAHRLEDFFKALYSDSVEFDGELEILLLQGYDCLSNPLLEQIESGTYDEEAALLAAEPVFATLEARLENALKNADSYIPSSNDLGVDIVASIFEVDVAQALEHLEEVLDNSSNYDLEAELQGTLEMFSGFAELFELPGFNEIIQTSQTALQQNPNKILDIARATLTDCTAAKNSVLEGDRDRGGKVSPALMELTEFNDSAVTWDQEELSFDSQDDGLWGSAPVSDPFAEDIFGTIPETAEAIADNNLEDIFGTIPSSENSKDTEEVVATDSVDDVFGTIPETAEAIADNNLEDIFGTIPSSENSQDAEEIVATDSVDDVFGTIPETEEAIADNNLEDIFGTIPSSENSQDTEEVVATDSVDDVFGTIPNADVIPEPIDSSPPGEKIENAVKSIENIIEDLPSIENNLDSLIPPPEKKLESKSQKASANKAQPAKKAAAKLSVKVDLERLERMNNLIGELTINRNSLALQNEQLQENVTELGQKFFRFREITQKLREISDEIVLEQRVLSNSSATVNSNFSDRLEESTEFDALEMDSYSSLYASIQNVLEEIVQLEESVDDITIFAKQSDRTINSQRQMLGQMRDELMWVRMLPLEKILQRFPRTLRDLSHKYHKPVNLKMTGTGVLVDKAVLEKLSDPLLHLLRNGFDHGIESPQEREKRGKSPHGNIEINAYHQGNQTVIEIKDDGKGLDVEKIAEKGIEKGLISAAEVANANKERIYDLIFEPGFSTAAKVSEISGRGVGMNIVRSQIETLKGRITVASTPGEGSIFTLRLPLTLTIAKLLVCSLGTTAFAIPSDSIEEIIIPTEKQIKISNGQKFLVLDGKLVPIYCLPKILQYNCPVPDADSTSKAFKTIDSPEDWFAPLLILRRGQKLFALEVVRLVSEQELVIKPYGKAIAAPPYSYGCTILGDGSLIPAFDGAALIGILLGEEVIPTVMEINYTSEELDNQDIDLDSSIETKQPTTNNKLGSIKTVMVVDDSTALRRTMALTLEKQGYRVIQKKDGKDALDGFRQNPHIDLIICDVEMPTMNGFEFLGMRRRDSQLAQIPTFMLTSRSGAKHRNLATQLGADGYFTKPYVEQEFVLQVKKILNNRDKETPIQQVSKSNSKNLALLKKTILIIDDSSALRRTLALSLENRGYNVLQGRDGKEGLAILRKNLQTNLVICDIEMPNMNGFEFLTSRRQEPNLTGIPVVMLTSRSTEKHRNLATSLGANGYFTKPYVEEKFIEDVDGFINKYCKS